MSLLRWTSKSTYLLTRDLRSPGFGVGGVGAASVALHPVPSQPSCSGLRGGQVSVGVVCPWMVAWGSDPVVSVEKRVDVGGEVVASVDVVTIEPFVKRHVAGHVPADRRSTRHFGGRAFR